VEACLLTHYAFEQPSIESLLSEEVLQALAARELDTPSALRLALWRMVNERYSGFAPVGSRAEILRDFAELCALPPAPQLIDALLALDSEGSAALVRRAERPTARQIMAHYNRSAVKTLLAHSRQVTLRLKQVPGATLKRTYFVAKRRGVFVDVERDGEGFALTLYGPEQATGGADKYGLRLADVALSLLRSLLSEAGDDAVTEATAYLVMHDRDYRFHITPDILERLEYVTDAQSGKVAERGAAYSVGGTVEAGDGLAASEPSFDSMVEARLYKEFKSLERQGYTHGWQLLREPDPLVAPGVVMIPDFAFKRGDACVYMEIAGFWTPNYRDRKLAKLRSLAQGSDGAALILAVPQEAAPAYSELPYPVTPYKTGVRATDLLALLNARYGDRERREDAGQEQMQGLRDAALDRGFVPEREVAAALQAYSRTELLSGARGLADDTVTYVAGVGLLSRQAFERLEKRVREALAASKGRLPLDDLGPVIKQIIGSLEVDVESLVHAFSALSVERPSLFEAYVVGV
jgi:predicted nuclease of restriction endonuclease-like RecB superfamily